MDTLIFERKFVHPFNMIIAAPSQKLFPLQGGKTQWLYRLLSSRSITPFPKKIVLVYQHDSLSYLLMQTSVDGIELIKTIPENLEAYLETLPTYSKLLVIDDSMGEVNKSIMQLILRGHHLNLSIILVVHNLFFKSQFTRTIFLNCHYIVLFRSPTDSLQVETVGRRMFPHPVKLFVDAFSCATALPYEYLLIDAKTETPQSLRLRASVLGEKSDSYQRVYLITKDMQEYVTVPAAELQSMVKEFTNCHQEIRKKSKLLTETGLNSVESEMPPLKSVKSTH